MTDTTNLKQRIAAHLSKSPGGAEYQRRKEQERQEALSFAEPVADLFNSGEFQELLETHPNLEVQLFCHTRSLLAAAYGGLKPDYELVVNKEGLCTKIRGKTDKRHPLPASLDTWTEMLPYGKNFDSSDGDYTYKPDSNNYMKRIEIQLERHLR